MSISNVVEFARFLTSSDMTSDLKYFTLNQYFNLCNLISKKHIKTSVEFMEYSKNAVKYDMVLYVPALSGNDSLTITDFISAMIYVNSQSRDKVERWDLSNLPNENSKSVAKTLLNTMKKQKIALGWMDV